MNHSIPTCKKLFIFFAILFSGSLFAQTEVFIHYLNNTEETYSITENGKIYFSENNLLIKEDSGTAVSIDVSSIRKLIFNNLTDTATPGIFQNATDIYIYPNPATDYINIACTEHSEPIQVKIFSLSGMLVWQNLNCNPNEAIDISYLPAGLYLLNINNKTIKFSKR